MNFHSRNQSIVFRLESAAMLDATDPEDDIFDGETVEYSIEEFEIKAFGGLSLGVWNVLFTAINCDGGWEHGPVSIENVDRGDKIVVDMAAVRDNPAIAAAYNAIELAILDAVGAYINANWTDISARCDAVVMERNS